MVLLNVYVYCEPNYYSMSLSRIRTYPQAFLLWELMAEKNTPLINELLWKINNHSDFEQWQSEGKLPGTLVSEICKSFKDNSLYAGQPSRFYLSVTSLVNYIYKSWLKLQKRRQRKLEGQEHWLSMLKSDTELLKESECSLDVLRKRAKEILNDIQATNEKSENKARDKKKLTKSTLLFNLYDKSEDALSRSAICYLLKNACKLPKPDKLEGLKKFAQRHRKVAIKIERLKNQIEGSRPHGRDLIRFNGLSQHTFQIYCDRRQLHWFQRFLEDQQIKKEGKHSHSSGLFTLRSAKLAWKQDKAKGEPWNANRLILYCTMDTRFWSAEGTEQARQEKEAKLLETITNMKEKGELTANQQAFVAGKQSTLAKLHNSFPRPSRKLYQGKPNIILGVAMGLDKPATVAIVDGETGDAIAFRSIKQLLGKDYQLLNRQRQQKQELSHLRHKAQKRSADNQKGESNLGEYVDRLIAKAIVELAKQYQVNAIAVPKIEDMRESIQSEIKAKAEAKIPGYEEGQKKYAKQYRINVHNWSYGRPATISQTT